ncbi:MAG: EpsI family protein [Nitrospirae bacterium]|nr:EpsI family protein [Nitrospirota bacterium]
MDISKKNYWLILGLLLLSVLYVRVLQPAGKNQSGELRLNNLPMKIGGWQGEEQPFPNWLPAALNAEEFFIRRYTNDSGNFIWLYVGHFGSRRGIHEPDRCYPDQGWKIVKRKVVSVNREESDSSPAEIVEMVVEKGLDRRLVLFWYQRGERVMARRFRYQLLLMGRAIIKGRTEGGVIIRVSALVRDDNFDDVLAYEKQFMQVLIPVIPKYLPK